MNKFYTVLFFLLISVTGFLHAQPIPTWSDNVACIIYTRCTPCHHPGGAAPFSLMTYAEASGAASGIFSAVTNNRMPPWPPDPAYRSFAHQRALTAQEKQIIEDWVTFNTPQGNPAFAPVPPVYSSSEVIQNPDLTVTMPVYTIPPISNDLYRCFVIPSGTSVQKFITGMEVIPGNPSVVHHVIVYEDTTNTPAQLDAQDPGPGYTSFGGTGSNSSRMLGAWVPGSSPDFYPTGMGVPLTAGGNIVIQVHYPIGSSFQQDSTKINFRLTTNPATRSVSIAPALNHGFTLTNGPLFIPADSVKTFNSQLTVPAAVTLLGIAPHMHLIGKSIRSWAVTAQGTNIPLIDIPNWNFMWQGTYNFRQPIKIPAFSTLFGQALYDNTTNNINNPSNPPQDVSLGEATTDEMMLIYFSYLTYQAGDENIIIDTTTSVNTYNGCNYQLITGLEQPSVIEEPINIHPNPAGDIVSISLPSGFGEYMRLYDISGRIIWTRENIQGRLVVEADELPSGLYRIVASRKDGGIRSASLMIQH